MADTVTIEVVGDKHIENELKEMSRRARAAVTAVIHTYALKVQRTIKHLLSQPGSGRIYERGEGIVHQASAPGEPPATDTGRLRSSIQYTVQRLTAIVFTNVIYARALELGNEDQNLEPRPFFEPALDEHREDFLDDIKRAIDQAL